MAEVVVVLVIVQVLMVVLVEVELLILEQDLVTLQAHHLLKEITEVVVQVMLLLIME